MHAWERECGRAGARERAHEAQVREHEGNVGARAIQGIFKFHARE